MRAELMAAVAVGLALAGPAQAETITVQIRDIAFAPAMISARVGDTVVWSNDDIVAHTATARDKSWDVTIAPKKSQSLTLTRAGSIEYYCRFHPNMVGRVTVGD